MKNSQRGFAGIVIIILLAVAALGGGTYFYYTNASKGNYDDQLAILGPKGISNMLNQNSAGSSEIQKEISKRILNESGDTGERIGLSRILGESNSPEALETLANVTFTTKNTELYNSTVEQLSRMGRANSDQQAKQLTDVAIASYKNSAQKPELYYLFGGIIAKLGQPEGVNFLKEEATKGGSTITALNTSENKSAEVSMKLSRAIRGISSVSILADSLKISDPNSTEFIWSGQALSSIGFREGASALLDWARNAPDSCAELAGIWLGNFKDSRANEVMKDFSPLLKFKSQKVKDAVIKAAKKYENSYSSPISNTMTQDKDASSDYEKINYVGKYTFTEAGAKSTSKLARYTLSVYENSANPTGVLSIYTDINGYKSTENINIRAVDENGVFKVIFESTDKNSQYPLFQKGDTLFTLVTIDGNKFRINWDKMNPMIYKIEDLTNNFFVKIP